MKWITQTITPGCLAAAETLGAWPWLHAFYLAGGTALALTYGHRVSVDLDFFSSTNDLGFTQREPMLADLRKPGARVEDEKDGTLHLRLKNTHLSFFRYRYPCLRPLRRWGQIKVAHPVDIGLMKLGAIIGRGSRKDFVDLYMILKNEISLASLLRLAPKKFAVSNQFKLQVMKALVYFADADTEPELKMRQNVASWPAMKQFFESEVRTLARDFR